MKTSRKAICLIALTGCLCAAATATDYTFNASSGDWSIASNWQPYTGYPPVVGDTANIPASRTCIVANADQGATSVSVASGGTLRINNRHLTISAGGGTGMTVNGTVEFENTATLTTPASLTITGSGQLVTLSGATAYVGPLLEDNTVWLTISRGTTLKGSFKFYTNVHNDGVLAVDDAGHDMEIGEADGGSWQVVLNGSGTYRATAGQLRIGKCAPQCSPEAARVVVNGGTFKLCAGPGMWVMPWDVIVSAGTLIFDDDFSTTGSLDFTGGKIQVKYDEAVEFSS
jgi:hypothetical protein